MRKSIPLIFISFCLLAHSLKVPAQNVGIGISTPHSTALLHVDVNTSTTKGLLITGTYNSSATVPNLGSGSRLMFYPGKAAFRAGFVDVGGSSTNWDNANVGFFSSATGYNTIASGQFSTATGSGNNASGYASTAMGEGTSANNNYSISMGRLTQASGVASTTMGFATAASGTAAVAMGNNSIASGANSLAAGLYTVASGENSTALGYYTAASGYASVAMGLGTVASGNGSFALGNNVNTNNNFGAFIFGDSDPNGEGITYSGYTNEFVARFWNGYYFMTSGNVNRFGVAIGHNGNSWVSICDQNRKENFEALDGEDVLKKLSRINFTSWNYKQQDPKLYRHYGIMAQDFYNAFGHDDYGIIGNDTTVNPIDMIGIDMTAIQALEKRTANLKEENSTLKEENSELKKSLTDFQQQLDEQKKAIDQLLAISGRKKKKRK